MQATCLVGSFLETDTKDIVISRAVIYAAFSFLFFQLTMNASYVFCMNFRGVKAPTALSFTFSLFRR